MQNTRGFSDTLWICSELQLHVQTTLTHYTLYQMSKLFSSIRTAHTSLQRERIKQTTDPLSEENDHLLVIPHLTQ